MELKGKKILVAGAGKSGQAAAQLLTNIDCEIGIYDGNVNLNKEAILEKMPEGVKINFELGEFKDELADEYDLLVLSPGISIHKPVAVSFYNRKKEVWGEIELASWFAKGKVAAITGTNGKTTTTALVGTILREYYKSVFVVGNIGIPYTSVAAQTTEESAIAAEISSFQLETTIDFKPAVSAVLNVTPDHLDRHGSMEVYADTKLSISKKQTKDDVIILNYDDPITREMAFRTPARAVYFSRKEDLKEGIVLVGNTFVIRTATEELPVCSTDEIQLLGGHNHENILAAIGMGYYMGVPVSVIRTAVMKFTAVEHRIEYVDTVDGVMYYNDSKGTNPDAAIKGIQAMNRPTVLLGGGYDKHAEFDEWIESFDGKVKCLILIGATAPQIARTAEKLGFEPVVMADTFEEAMDIAREKAQPGDAVLLSPACASWGMFPNYEVRGQRFKEIVRSFKE